MAGMFKKPDAPKPPDPQATAAAQTDQSVATAIANTIMGQVNQTGPNGSLSYDQTGSYTFTGPGGTYSIPRFTATTTYTPEGEAINDANQAAQLNLATIGKEQSGRMGELLNRPVDASGVTDYADRTTSRVPTYGASPDLPAYTAMNDNANLIDSYRTDHSGDRQTYEDALFSRIQPQLDKQRENIQRELAARGVRPGSVAYDRAMNEYSNAANDARYGAILNASGEQARLEGLDQNAATFTNQARQQQFVNSTGQTSYNNSMLQQALADRMMALGREDANANNTFAMQQQEMAGQDAQRSQQLNEKFAIRNQPLQELLSIMNGTALTNPNFAIATPDKIATTDIAGINQQGYANQMAAYQQKMAQYNAMMGGLFDLGSAFVGRPAA